MYEIWRPSLLWLSSGYKHHITPREIGFSTEVPASRRSSPYLAKSPTSPTYRFCICTQPTAPRDGFALDYRDAQPLPLAPRPVLWSIRVAPEAVETHPPSAVCCWIESASSNL